MSVPQIKASLIRLLEAIRQGKGDVVVSEMEALEKLRAGMGDAIHPQLAHFIDRRSYAKALAYLEGESSASLHA